MRLAHGTRWVGPQPVICPDPFVPGPSCGPGLGPSWCRRLSRTRSCTSKVASAASAAAGRKDPAIARPPPAPQARSPSQGPRPRIRPLPYGMHPATQRPARFQHGTDSRHQSSFTAVSAHAAKRRDSAAGPVARDTSALVPEVAFLHDQPVSPKTEQRHPGQILVTAVGQPGLRAPRNGCLITIDNWLAKPALRRFLLREHTG
jgi:hypothetical protein